MKFCRLAFVHVQLYSLLKTLAIWSCCHTLYDGIPNVPVSHVCSEESHCLYFPFHLGQSFVVSLLATSRLYTLLASLFKILQEWEYDAFWHLVSSSEYMIIIMNWVYIM